MPRFLLISLCVLLTMFARANHTKQLNRAYEALQIYDYFKAKKIFYGINKNEIDYAAAYGLAMIYHRRDNPFSQNDSASKYIHLSYEAFLAAEKTYTFNATPINAERILLLSDSICSRQFHAAQSKSDITVWEYFLKHNTLAKPALRRKAVYQRDELVFAKVLKENKSDSTRFFMHTFPMSDFYGDAFVLLQREIFSETTKHQKAEEYIYFLKNYPGNVMVNEAYEQLFELYRKRQSISGLHFFVKNYPSAPQWLEAWKLLFSLSVKAYTSEELTKFLDANPQFPLKNSILKELELNNITLYPIEKDDFIGYINEEAQFVIPPQFDQAGEFNEGLAVVSRNDSVYYINKENVNPFNRYYSDAYPFKNGLAAVKQQNKWVFINRQGQIVSKQFEEVNEMSNNLYVVKLNGKYGACNQYAQLVIEAKFDKLGDFKNNLAYFVAEGKYGFVDVKGHQYKEGFDWISDFDEKGFAIYKTDNKFGLVNALGEKRSENMFDQILKLSDQYYMVINQNMYGVYSADGCFVVPVMYDYNKEKSLAYYYKSDRFKLLKNPEMAIVDANGHFDINFSSYKEIDFMSNGLMLARKKNKYGYIDKKQNVVIPFKYLEASNFSDSIALVKTKKEYQMIAVSGKELFVSEQKITKLNAYFYTVGDEVKTLINARGETVLTEVLEIKQINNSRLLVTFVNGQQQLIKY